MATYTFLQHYWWFVVALLGGLLVFMLFVQGANSMLFQMGSEDARRRITSLTGRKWEITFTTLVTFGGAFFASFPLFYSTSFGGAYWVWMLILLTFVVHAVSYEFPEHAGNILGRRGYWALLTANGILGPFLLGAAVATLFTGAPFTVSREAIAVPGAAPVSAWATPWHGLDALADPWNWVLGLAVLFLARYLGALYLAARTPERGLSAHDTPSSDPRGLTAHAPEWRCYRLAARRSSVAFLAAFLAFAAHLLTRTGLRAGADGLISAEPYAYFHSLLAMPAVAATLLLGVALVLLAIIGTWLPAHAPGRRFWIAAAGTVLTVLALLLLAGYGGMAYYPSLADRQSSLTIANSSSSPFTLTVMAWASLAIPFVVAYIAYVWRALERPER